MQLSPVIIMPLMLVGGQFVNPDSMPVWLRYFSYISPFTYAFENFCTVEFESSEYPAAKQTLGFLGFEREYWDGILILVCLTAVIQILALILLKMLVTKFQ